MNQSNTKLSQLICFKKYSRKKYAAFNSIGRIIKISTLSVTCSLIVGEVQAQSKTESDSISTRIDLDEVEVVGQKSTVLLDELPRMVEIIDARSIQYAPVQSFQEILQFNSNIDISQRGQPGIQSDISIRGSSFDQVLVLQNGINLTDPQTGHHSLNLSSDPESVHSIEILNGPAARALGANAFAGAINVNIKPYDKSQITASTSMGEYGFFRTYLGLNHAAKNVKQLLAGSYSKSDGYMFNTDFEILNLNYSGEYILPGNTKMLTQFGFNNKAFGANSFYSPKYPDQFEEISSLFFSIGLRSGSLIKFKPEIYWRRHSDRFELFREDDSYYSFFEGGITSNDTNNTAYQSIPWYTQHNHHLTDIFGANLQASFTGIVGTTTIGSSVRSENIVSNALGKDMAVPLPVEKYDSVFYTKQDFRNSFDLFLEQTYQHKKLFVSAGALVHSNSFDAQKINLVPGVDVSYNLVKNWLITGSYNYTIGHPTFTDIWYKGPNNIGNADLRPYFQNSYEMGTKFSRVKVNLALAAFYTQGKNNIDWLLNASDSLNPFYKATNITLSENYGFEASFRYSPIAEGLMGALVHDFYFGYTYIQSYRSVPVSVSKYGPLNHKISARLEQKFNQWLLLSWNFLYKQRSGTYLSYSFENNSYLYNVFPEVFLMDARISAQLSKVLLYLEITNLLNSKYVESGSITQPGSWLKVGVMLRIND